MHWNSQPHIKGTPVEESKDCEVTEENEPTPDYSTEKCYETINIFKKAMGLFPDNYKLNYCLANR